MNRIALPIFIVILLTSLEALVSGTQRVSGSVDFVYAEIRVGLKVQKGENDNGHRENKRRMAAADIQAKALAKAVKTAIDNFRKNHNGLRFLAVAQDYYLYDKGMSGYTNLPTLVSDDEAKAAQGKPCYYLLSKEPLVTIHFETLPELEVLNQLKSLVVTASASIATPP